MGGDCPALLLKVWPPPAENGLHDKPLGMALFERHRMFSSLSTRQRTTLVSVLVVSGEASVVAGIFLGWSAAALISASAACLLSVILIVLSASAALGRR